MAAIFKVIRVILETMSQLEDRHSGVYIISINHVSSGQNNQTF